MHFLVVDTRFAAPVHVFLEENPGADDEFPNLAVRQVTLESALDQPARGPRGSGVAVGLEPYSTSSYRIFPTDGTVRSAGYGLIEPRYVGTSWASYSRAFRFGAKTVGRN